jgi:hypothetical protein
MVSVSYGQSSTQPDPYATPGLHHQESIEKTMEVDTPNRSSVKKVGEIVTIIESRSANVGHDMDLEWFDLADSLGYIATIHPQTALEDSALLDTTDILIVSSGVIDIPAPRGKMILNFLKSGKPVYLQNEYLCTYSSNMLFKEIVDSLGGGVALIGTVSGDLKPMNVSGPLSNTPNQVDSLTYFWYGCNAAADSVTVIPFLEYGGNTFGFIFTPPNPSYGVLITTSDQDWVRNPSGYLPPLLLMENILHYLSTGGTVDISVKESNFISGFSLEQNYPNPFNPATTISYQLKNSSDVRLQVFNQLGQSVRQLVNRKQPAGNHLVEWDGRDDDGNEAASGVYIYQLKTNQGTQSKKMLLLK